MDPRKKMSNHIRQSVMIPRNQVLSPVQKKETAPKIINQSLDQQFNSFDNKRSLDISVSLYDKHMSQNTALNKTTIDPR
jgi:hypothetical protein